MEKEGNDAKIIINIGTAYNVNPSAKVVNNTFKPDDVFTEDVD